MTCKARPDRYERGSMRCDACRLVWDVEDPEPPACPSKPLTFPNHAIIPNTPLKFCSGLPFSSPFR